MRLTLASLVLLLCALVSGRAIALVDAQADDARIVGTAPSSAAAPRAENATPQAAVDVVPAAPAEFDYSVNVKSDVFGAQLFTGSFARQGPSQFSPDYAIAVGDRLRIRFWGGFEFDADLVVDPKGNVFLPHVGPVRVLGVRNEDLQRVVESAVRTVFRTNVYSYTSLAAAQPVSVFVSGFVNRPGLYHGTSTDSILHYLDQAGGVDPERGTFLDVQVKRGELVRARFDLYDFLLEGNIPLAQLADGDVIFVPARASTIRVGGLVENQKRFELDRQSYTVADLAALANPRPDATHVRVVRNRGAIRNVEYYPLEQASEIALENGDELEFTADKRPGTITVRVEGEHLSAQEYVLPYGARLGELLGGLELSDRSDIESLQLFRRSVKARQKEMLTTLLQRLETSVLTARSGTSDEAKLRREEADLILEWVERARAIEPAGQVVVADASSRDALLLENGDILRVPRRDGLVLVSGEVLFPNAVAFDAVFDLEEYVERAGGYTQNANASRVVVAHRDGTFDEIDTKARTGWFGAPKAAKVIRPGDEVLVLPRIDVKSRQIAKDLTQILYQIAVSAKVVFGGW
jgi:protein involved in polysaccharide export with SLBB domain